jgi:hypothetical protein
MPINEKQKQNNCIDCREILTKSISISRYGNFKKYLFCFAFLFILHPSSLILSQEKDSLWLNSQWYYSTEDSSIIDWNILLPPFLRDELQLKRIIRDERFLQLRTLYSDTLAIDAIFDRAMIIAGGEKSHALFIATMAVMDHFRLGIRIPLLGVLSLPLTTESKEKFNQRSKNLPRRVLGDKKLKRIRDEDKLQHFFGSAYLTYVTGSKFLANAAGNFVEWGEERFIIGGAWDERDRAANRLGQEFGIRLLSGEDVLPSDVLWEK